MVEQKITYFPTNGLNPFTGYGKLEIGLMDSLQDHGVKLTSKADVMLVVGNAKWVEGLSYQNKRVWLYTMSESTKVSEKWVDIINNNVERVFVPCPALVDIFESSGVKVPVCFVNSGVDLPRIEYVERDPQPETFTFLTYSLGDLRKGAELVIVAFKKLFRDMPNFKLIVKCRDNKTWLSGCMDTQIEIIEGQRSEEDWYSLLARANAFVFPSRGEGFGMPPREATLSGLPTIATNWLGMWDIGAWGFPIAVQEMRPAQFSTWEANADGACWSEPDSVSLENQMMWVVNNYQASLTKAKRGRGFLLSKFTYDQMGRQIASMLSELT